VGLIAGMGELAGYGSRLLSGVLSDRLQRLWLFMFRGPELSPLRREGRDVGGF
jgi:hypothetical protein